MGHADFQHIPFDSIAFEHLEGPDLKRVFGLVQDDSIAGVRKIQSNHFPYHNQLGLLCQQRDD